MTPGNSGKHLKENGKYFGNDFNLVVVNPAILNAFLLISSWAMTDEGRPFHLAFSIAWGVSGLFSVFLYFSSIVLSSILSDMLNENIKLNKKTSWYMERGKGSGKLTHVLLVVLATFRIMMSCGLFATLYGGLLVIVFQFIQRGKS